MLLTTLKRLTKSPFKVFFLSRLESYIFPHLKYKILIKSLTKKYVEKKTIFFTWFFESKSLQQYRNKILKLKDFACFLNIIQRKIVIKQYNLDVLN